jgi:hypothetical protein
MASIDLEQVWVHDAGDLASFVRLPVRELEAAPTRRVEAREYASGRLRRISRPAHHITVSITARLLSRGMVDRLDAWTGETLMLRDPRGRKLWGFFRELGVTEHAWTDRADVAFRFVAITQDEAV